jgi:hypothetical protein
MLVEGESMIRVGGNVGAVYEARGIHPAISSTHGVLRQRRRQLCDCKFVPSMKMGAVKTQIRGGRVGKAMRSRQL